MSNLIPIKLAEQAMAVRDEEIARLKAEVEAYRSASDEVAAAFLTLPTPHNQFARVCEGIESLKAEVERLTEIIRREVDGGVDLREEAQRTVEENHKLRAEVERLKGIILAQSSDFVRSKTADDGIKPEGWNSAVAKAVDLLAEKDKEIARLRKAGDEMANRLTDPDRGKSYFYPVLHDALCAWTAAKEGKPSV